MPESQRESKWRVMRSPFGGYNVIATVGSQVIGQFATCVTLANAKATRDAQIVLEEWQNGGMVGPKPCRLPEPAYVPAARRRWLASLAA